MSQSPALAPQRDAELIAPSTDGEDPLIGAMLLSKLRVLRRIGAGGAGVVYEVEHLITKHRRALKTLKATARDSPVAISRFLREAGIAGRLKSPRIVETFDAGRLPDGTPYVLMELLQGRSLDRVLREDGPLAPNRLIGFAVDVCDALEAAHAAGVVHRDIKPENIFLIEPGVPEHVKVLDFGICKALDPTFDEMATLTGEGASVGTPYFMAPEQIEGSDAVDARTDVYALGVTLYQLASGELPFTANSAAALAVKIERGAHRPLDGIAKGVSRRLARTVERAMARRPEDRFPSIAALRAELLEIASEPGGAPEIVDAIEASAPVSELAETSTALVRDAGRKRLGRGSVAAIAAGITATLAAAAFLVPRLGRVDPHDPKPAASAPIPGSMSASETADVEDPLPSASTDVVATRDSSRPFEEAKSSATAAASASTSGVKLWRPAAAATPSAAAPTATPSSPPTAASKDKNPFPGMW
ncbi:MAG: serine/threonine-protein kinase [Polyangiaceae bacterium]